jgi:hypothetical protein
LGVRVSDTAGNVVVGLTNSNNYEVDTTLFGWIRQLIQSIVHFFVPGCHVDPDFHPVGGPWDLAV